MEDVSSGKYKFMKNCHKLRRDVSGRNYNAQSSGVSRPGIRLRAGDDSHFRLCNKLKEFFPFIMTGGGLSLHSTCMGYSTHSSAPTCGVFFHYAHIGPQIFDQLFSKKQCLEVVRSDTCYLHYLGASFSSLCKTVLLVPTSA